MKIIALSKNGEAKLKKFVEERCNFTLDYLGLNSLSQEVAHRMYERCEFEYEFRSFDTLSGNPEIFDLDEDDLLVDEDDLLVDEEMEIHQESEWQFWVEVGERAISVNLDVDTGEVHISDSSTHAPTSLDEEKAILKAVREYLAEDEG